MNEAQMKVALKWLINAKVVKDNGDQTYSLTKEARDLMLELVVSERTVLKACVLTVLRISHCFLDAETIRQYAGIVKALYLGKPKKEERKQGK